MTDGEPEIQRMIQEYVPGKQITLAHLIANPDEGLYKKLGVAGAADGALGILTITPSEASIIAADISTKSASVEIVFMDRFSGSLVISGDVASIENSLQRVLDVLCGQMGFSRAQLTRT